MKNFKSTKFSRSLNIKVLLGSALIAATIINSSISFAESELTAKGYQLEEIVVLSRHNLRSPLSSKGSFQDKATPHEWFRWTAPTGHLSLHGGLAETSMGQYFRKYLEDDKFIPQDWQPKYGQVRFYANSYQRTIATAQYFSSGMLPIANVRVLYKYDIDKHDPVFLPDYDHSSAAMDEAAFKAENDMYNGQGIAGFIQTVNPDLPSVEKILDFKNSEYAHKENINHLNINNTALSNKSHTYAVAIQGDIEKISMLCDTLQMQYFEIPDDVQAAWGNNEVTHEDWEHLGHLLDASNYLVWGNYYNAITQSRNMLKEIKAELTNDTRKFSFLCGHDTNLGTTITALQVENFELPGVIDKKTPIGGKLVFEKRLGQDGVEYVDISMIYAIDKQLRNIEILDLDNPPQRYHLKFKTLIPNGDGLYRLDDFIKLIDDTEQTYEKYVNQ